MLPPFEPENGVPIFTPEVTGDQLPFQAYEDLSVSPGLADKRVKKYEAADLPSLLGRDAETLRAEIQVGKEPALRAEIANKLSVKDLQRRQEAITNIVRQRGEPLTLDEYYKVMNSQPNFDPATVVEEEYAKYFMRILDNQPEGAAVESKQKDPAGHTKFLAEGSTFIAKNNLLQTYIEDATEAVEKQSTVGYIVDRAKEFVPLYSQIKQRGVVPGAGYFSGVLQGNNTEEQALQLYSKSTSEIKEILETVKNRMGKDNPGLFAAWLNDIQGQSSQEKFLNNFFSALDIATFPGIGLASKAALSGTRAGMSAAVKNVVKESANPAATKATIAEAAGDLSTAAAHKASNRLVDNLKLQTQGGRNLRFEQGVEDLVGALRKDIDEFRDNPGKSLSRDGVLRLEKMTENTIDNFVDTVTKRVRVERLGVLEASEAAMKQLQSKIPELYPGLSNNLLDVNNVIYDKDNYWVDMLLGRNNTTLFSSFQEASNWAKWNGLEAKNVTKNQLGTGYYVRAVKPLPETSDIVRDLIQPTKLDADVDSWTNAWVGWLRNPDDTLNMEQRMNRKAATYGASALLNLAKEEAKYIQGLSGGLRRKNRWEDFSRMLDNLKQAEVEFKNPLELENWYQTNYKRLPDEAETYAYFSYKHITEMDLALRRMHLFKNKTRLGVENHRFPHYDQDGNKVFSDWFEGLVHRTLPTREGNSVLVMGKTGWSVTDAGHYNNIMKKNLEADLAAGRGVILEVYDPERFPFAKLVKDEEKYIRYVYVRTNIETRPLQYVEQLPRKVGGHYDYDYSDYLKQAKLSIQRTGKTVINRYLGDKTIAAVAVRAMGEDVAKTINAMRVAFRRKDEEAAKAIYDRGGAPMPFETIRGWFMGAKTEAGGHLPPTLSLTEPVMVVPRGKRITDLDASVQLRAEEGGKKYIDGTRQGSLARQHQLDYTQERDVDELFAIGNEGSRHNPIWKWEPAKFVDPIQTMERAFTKLAKSAYMDDYKIASVEAWMQKAKNFMKDPDLAVATPYHSFANPEWRSGVDAKTLANLERERWQVQQLLGQRSTTDNLLHSAAQKIVDDIYSKAGTKGLIIDPLNVLPKIKDPFRFIRSVAYNFKLGLYAVPQVMVQLQTFGVISGLAPKHAANGTAAMLFAQWARLNKNPEIIDKLDTMLTKLRLPGTSRWKPGEFKEALDALHRSGFYNVGGEVATLDDFTNPRLLTSKGKAFLDAGQFFFREGERASRMGAWFTSYREFRVTNPTGRLTNSDMRKILERADILTVNMSRASSSPLHTGFMSVPAQFLAYQIRMAELVLGKRLTVSEKVTLFGVQSALYGVPTALGLSGLPLADFLRKNALENGYVVGDNAFEQLATEGLPSLLLSLTTGNTYNIGDRYGSGGFETLREALRGDKTWYEVAGGASFSVLSGVFSAADGFGTAVLSGLRGDDKVFPATIEDATDMFKEVTSFNQAWKFYMAASTGKWLSKKEMYLTDTTAGNALFMAMTGLQPQGVADLQLMAWSKKDETAKNKYVGEKFTQEFRRALREHENNPEQAKKYFTRAFLLLDMASYPEEQRATLLARATKDYESLIESMNWSFYTENVPTDQRDARMEALIKTLKQGR